MVGDLLASKPLAEWVVLHRWMSNEVSTFGPKVDLCAPCILWMPT